MPSATIATTVATGMRSPRMQGTSPICLGLTAIREHHGGHRAICARRLTWAPARAMVFEDPRHPYTKKLMAEVPVVDPGEGRKEFRLATDEIASPLPPIG